MQTGDATSRPHYICWRTLACDRRIFGTGVRVDVFLSSQILAGTTAILLPITEMVSQTLVRDGVCALAAHDTVTMPLQCAHVIRGYTPPKHRQSSSRPHSARLTMRIWLKTSVADAISSIAASVCGCWSSCDHPRALAIALISSWVEELTILNGNILRPWMPRMDPSLLWILPVRAHVSGWQL